MFESTPGLPPEGFIMTGAFPIVFPTVSDRRGSPAAAPLTDVRPPQFKGLLSIINTRRQTHGHISLKQHLQTSTGGSGQREDITRC